MKAIPLQIPPGTPESDIDERMWQGAWKGRARGLFTGLVSGLLFGLALGALAGVLIPLVVGLTGVATATGITIAGVTNMALIFGAIGSATGVVLGTDVGSSAGAAGSGTKEVLQEVRGIRHELAALRGEDLSHENPYVSAYPHRLAAEPPPSGIKKYVNWKVLLTCAIGAAALGALFTLMAAGSGGLAFAAMAPIFSAAGLSGTIGAGHYAASMMAMGLMGSTFGVNMPLITGKMSTFMGNLLGGQVFERSKRETSTPIPAPVVEKSIPRSAQRQQAMYADAPSQETAIPTNSFRQKIAEQRQAASLQSAVRQP